MGTEIINYDIVQNPISQYNYSKKLYKLGKNWNNFKIDDTIWFNDIIWDFNELNHYSRERNHYKYNFDKIPEPFMFYVKSTIFEDIKIRKNRHGTANKTLEILQKITGNLYEQNVKDVRLIDKVIVEKYFNHELENCKASYVETEATRYKKLILTIEDILGYDLLDVVEYLNDIMRFCRTMRPINSVNDYIPDQFLNQLVSLAIKDLDDEDLEVDYRIIACLIVLLAETGMRAEEVTLLETNHLDTIEVNGKQLCYLKFLTFKSSGIVEARETYSALTDKALKAYKTCERLAKNVINDLNEQTKLRLLWILYTNEPLKKYVSVFKLRKMVSKIDDNELKELEKETTRYLYISVITGLPKRGSKVFRENLERFFIRHGNDFNLENIPDNQRKNIKILQLKSEARYNKFYTVKERESISFEEAKDKKFYFVNPHMFRVTVCTKLFMQDVHLDFIVKHLNHLTEEMSCYYNKSGEFINSLAEGTMILSSISNKKGLIETETSKINNEFLKTEMRNQDFRLNVDKINEFLKSNNLNIKDDLDKVIKILHKTASPIVENEFGICVRTVINGLCRKRKYFSSISDNYFLQGTLPTYRYIHYTYERYQQKLEIVNHNRKIAKKDDMYMLEYEREEKALKMFVKNNLSEQLMLLNKDLNELGSDVILSKYPQIENILLRLNDIRKEIMPWME